MGQEIHDPQRGAVAEAPPLFLRQGVEVAVRTEDPPLDEAWFVGLALGGPVDRLEIREVGSVVNAFGDPYCENDFVGSVLVWR